MKRMIRVPQWGGGDRAAWLISTASFLLLLGLLSGCAASVQPAVTAPPVSEPATVEPGTLPEKGSPDAPVVLVVFCDFV